MNKTNFTHKKKLLDEILKDKFQVKTKINKERLVKIN